VDAKAVGVGNVGEKQVGLWVADVGAWCVEAARSTSVFLEAADRGELGA
jgi:hypothetical protein